MTSMSNVYDRIRISEGFLSRAIVTAESAAPVKKSYKIPLTAAACAAALVLGVGAVWMFRPEDVPTAEPAAQIGFDTAAAFGMQGAGDDALMLHDGVALWIEGAYYNGETMTVAVRGDYERYLWQHDSPPDEMRCFISKDCGASVTVNGQEASLLTEEPVLTKHGRYFEGVLELDVGFDESIVMLEIHIPALELYSGGEAVKTVHEDIGMTNIIRRTYVQDEDALLGGQEVMCVRCVAAEAPGAVKDAPTGLYLEYRVPDAFSGRDVKARVYNADGSEIGLIRSAQMTDADGRIVSDQFGYPTGRRVGVVLYDADTGEVLFVCSAFLNDPQIAYAADD